MHTQPIERTGDGGHTLVCDIRGQGEVCEFHAHGDPAQSADRTTRLDMHRRITTLWLRSIGPILSGVAKLADSGCRCGVERS